MGGWVGGWVGGLIKPYIGIGMAMSLKKKRRERERENDSISIANKYSLSIGKIYRERWILKWSRILIG